MKPKIKAYLKQMESGQLKSDGARVLYHIKKHPFSILPEIKRKLHMSHQTASARLSDLLDLGIIEEKGTTKNGSHTYFKFQPDPKEMENNAHRRKKEKFSYWLKQGINKFSEFINPQLKQELEYENNHELSS